MKVQVRILFGKTGLVQIKKNMYHCETDITGDTYGRRP